MHPSPAVDYEIDYPATIAALRQRLKQADSLLNRTQTVFYAKEAIELMVDIEKYFNVQPGQTSQEKKAFHE